KVSRAGVAPTPPRPPTPPTSPTRATRNPRSRPTTGGHVTVYRALLLAYPPRFRHEYEPLLLQAFRDRLRDARATSRGAGIALFWGGILRDLVRSATRERIDAVTGLRLRDWTPISSGGTSMARYTAR